MSRPISSLKSKRLHLRLRPAAETKVRSGHPWVFADSIREQNREGKVGELAVIFDRNNSFLALGFYDPDSPIRVRVVHRGKPANIDADWWRARLQESIARRVGIADSSTNALRWINGESDGFPALVLDQYAETLVLKLYSQIWFTHLPMIVSLVESALRPERMVLRLSRNILARAKAEGLSDAAVLVGTEPSGPIIFLESGLRFEADVLKGQKTGFFLDQRQNRRLVESLSRGREVLNAFSFSGGFSLYAARGGAKSVTDVDISAHALESSRRNFALNPEAVAGTQHRLVQADVFEWLQEKRSERYDLVILDPPSLAKREIERSGAFRAYANLAETALRFVRQRGTLVCCSCSAHIRAAEFFETIKKSVRLSGRTFKIAATTREPFDHHATFPEAEYLKAMFMELEST